MGNAKDNAMIRNWVGAVWLHAHYRRDAVAAAYGWPADMPEEKVLARLLALKLRRELA